ncbi:hypothetical protein DWB85_11910 [Seongchinamella sediminis]|uniref:Uncharacterized protein n=1 Tax=Seongchinamella sediminis TaxID=2283635 RepID=A0A3L7DZA1_9GAMM|nr:hypothetical protein DWB85_11910 [Seongchinamella sediminis]
MRDIVERVACNSQTGDTYLHLAEMLLEKHEWGLALRAVESALDKGCLADVDGAHSMLREICKRLDTRYGF